ncbi:hypothetical protein BU15DRAFT_67054 [Melanogaster broomeanus]|nr:hypothetical protein BU15DRAFT_67054 [Melanogaster broomeanus]
MQRSCSKTERHSSSFLATVVFTLMAATYFHPANSAMPTTVPVSNNSEIEIHKKRFSIYIPTQAVPPRAQYDPFERPSNDTWDAPKDAAHVHDSECRSLHPSPKQECERKSSNSSKPTQTTLYVAAETTVEEEKDLVILESVEVEVPPPPPPQTPARVRCLWTHYTRFWNNPIFKHRASVHRAILKHEVEREEEEEEEKEVEDFIAEEAEGHDDGGNGDQGDYWADEEEGEGEHDHLTQPTDQGSHWRKSIEVVKGFAWPFRSSSASPEVENQETEEEEEEETDDVRISSCVLLMLLIPCSQVEMNVDNELPPSSDSVTDSPTELAPSVEPSAGTPARPRQWGNFMTPQVPPVMNSGVGRGAGRYSFGGALAAAASAGPRRVRVEPKWKVNDIVVPLSKDVADDNIVEPGVRQEEKPHLTPGTGRKMRISEEERKVLPGMGARRYSNMPAASPARLPSHLSSATRSHSPTKLQNGSPTKLSSHVEEQSGSEEEEDTRSLLDRMRKTVEELKWRRSIGPPLDAEDNQDEAEQDSDTGGT